MRNHQRRIEGVMARLTAAERAAIVLRSFKEDAPEDPGVRRTMPVHQFEEFNRLVELINGVNGGLGALVLFL